MIYSKQVYKFANNLVCNYAKCYDKFYHLNLSDIPDFVLSEFASLLMSHNESWASEATGPDNPYYENKMLPALQRYMSNPNNKELEEEFKNKWLEGTTYYFYKEMQEIIDDACNDYTHSENWEYSLISRKYSDNNEIDRNRI